MKKRKFILLSLIVSAFILVNLNVISEKANGNAGITLKQLIQTVKADEECGGLYASCTYNVECCWGLWCDNGQCKALVSWQQQPCHFEGYCPPGSGGGWIECDGEIWVCKGDPYGDEDCGTHSETYCDCIDENC